MKKKNFLVAAVMISSRLLAQDQGDSTTSAGGASSYSELSRVIITAHKSNQRQSATGKVVNVILPEQIEQGKGRTLSELLNAIPGVSINGANNNLGTNQTVNIRGASAGNVLILIDGIPVNDPSVITNYYDLNLLPIDQVERIEIVKGGQSTLYGSDAVAGVINVITKKPAEKALAFNASASGGSYTTFKNTVGISGTNKSINYNLQYTDVYSQGFSAAYDSTGNKNFDKDGFRQHVLYGSLQWQLTQQLQAKFNGRLSNYNTGVDASAFTDDKDFTSTSKNWQGGAGLSYKLNKGQINLNYLYNKVVRTYTDDSSDRSSPFAYYSDSKYEGITHFAELYGNFNTAHVELLAGIDFRSNKTNQDYFSLGAFGPFTTSLKDTLAKMWQLSPYASVILKNDEGLSIEGGIRLNHHSEYGNNITYTFNPCYLIQRKLKIFGNLYSAFKAPALYQLFDPFYGNKDLKPEKSTTVEGGLEYFFTDNFRTRVVYFYRDAKDAIQFLLVDPGFFTYQYRNVNRQKSHGIEWEASYKKGRWQWDANYTHISGKTISPFDETGSELPRDTTYNNLYHIPKDVVNISAGVFIKKLFIKLQLKTVSKRLEPVYASQPKTLEGYYTLDLYGDYSFSKKCRVFLDLKNITNQKYFDILGYNSRRFNFMTGVSVNL
ncbi:MAG: TonB-dependent receptor [Bacteroidetes bacterium]|nr:MAG: TonB-dependent receptor [Bacteroidota bacterium]